MFTFLFLGLDYSCIFLPFYFLLSWFTLNGQKSVNTVMAHGEVFGDANVTEMTNFCLKSATCIDVDGQETMGTERDGIKLGNVVSGGFKLLLLTCAVQSQSTCGNC